MWLFANIDEPGGMAFQLASLDETGVVNIWVGHLLYTNLVLMFICILVCHYTSFYLQS